MAAPTLKFKRGLLSALPTLSVGEPGFTTDKNQLYVGSPNGNQLIGSGDFWSLETPTVGGGVKVFEATNNGTNYVQLSAPNSLAANLNFKLPSTDASASGQVLQSNASGVLSFGDVNITNIDIDGAADIGAAIVDDDLFIVDDGASGTNRKTTASRIKSYVLGGGGGGSTFDSVVVGSAVTINNSGIVASSGIVTASSFDGNLTGNVTGNVTGNLTGNVTGDVTGDLTGTADVATTITVADESTDTTCNILYTTAATGNLAPKSGTNLTFNSANGTLTATTFSGALSGNVTGDVTGDVTGNVTGDLTGDVTGNVTGNLTGTVLTASQTNITSVGTLGSLDVTNNITVGGTVDGRDVLDDGQAGDNLITLSGVARDATNLGTFTGNTIADNETLKGALQDLETELESIGGGGASAATVAIAATTTDAAHFLTFVDANNASKTQEAIHTDAGISYNPNSNLLTVGGEISVTTLDIGGTNVTATATELNVLDGVTAFVDEDNMASNSATSIPSQQSVKAYVDSSVSGVAVTFAVAADSGTTDLFQTGETITFSGTANEVNTVVSNNTVTIGLPDTVNITTELDVPTIETGAIQAKDGTAAVTLANSTGKVTVATDLEAQGTFTAATGAVFQGNTDIGNATSDTLTVTARIDSNLIPTPDATRNLGSASLAWNQGHIDQVTSVNNNVTGVTTSGTYKGSSLELTGGGSFGGNVTITGNLSVGGSVTSIDVEDLRIVSPVVELGLERVGDGSLQPPSNVTTYNSGVVMYYNHVGINSTNAKIAAMFAKIKQGGDMRIGFATDVEITTVGAGDSVASINAMADIEARGLWINDCAGVSQVISCTGTTRNLENIVIDGGSFA